ncbi:MAG: HD-GYP domain-containing protein [Brevinematia bacterium]
MHRDELKMLTIEELEREIQQGKHLVLVEPVCDDKMHILIGTSKVLTLKDLDKIKERCPEVVKKPLRIKHTVPHYITEEKRNQWIDFIISHIDKNEFFKTLPKDNKEFISKYLRMALKDNDYIVWKISQLRNFSEKIFLHTVYTTFISILAYKTYSLANKQGMIDGNELEKLIHASMLHSIGLMKFEVSFAERKRMEIEDFDEKVNFEQYPIESMRILHSEAEKHELSEDVIDAVLNHNEYIDGNGSPRGIGGDDLSLLARILAASNYFELLISGEFTLKPREYKLYIEKFRQMKGKLDKDVVDAIDKSFKHIFSNMTKEYLSNH